MKNYVIPVQIPGADSRSLKLCDEMFHSELLKYYSMTHRLEDFNLSILSHRNWLCKTKVGLKKILDKGVIMGKFKEFDIFERYAVSQIACRSGGPTFPISIKNYMSYIKYRANIPATFQRYVMGLETHRLHGPNWILRVRNSPDAIALIKSVDKRMSKLVSNYSSLFSRLGKVKEGNNRRKDEIKAHTIVVENNGKKGYMVIINSNYDNGTENNEDSQDSADQRIENIFPYVVAIRIKNKYLK